MRTRCPFCGNIVVYDRERVEYVCAVCDSVVNVESAWPYQPQYLEAVYVVKTAEKEKRAREVIRRYADENTVATLSGKDSEVALHLAVSSGVSVDVVIATQRLPQKIVNELKAIAESFGVRRIIIYDEPWDNAHVSLFSIISRRYNYNVVITGLRRTENRGHSMVEYIKAGKTVRLVNPVINWTTAEIWSYIYHHRLPVLLPYRLAPPDASLQHLAL